MFSHSLKTVRITDIPLNAEEGVLIQLAQDIAASQGDRGRWKLRVRSPVGRLPVVDFSIPVISLASQLQYKIGTITFTSEELKKKALGYRGGAPYSLDDVFNETTVLYSAAEPDLDICAVHGLNGNAFDTWAHDYKTMWLRDFLPTDHRFKQSRVMTFGYSSLLRDSSNVSSLTEWSQGLLLNLSSLRKSQAERSRPLIFVCHSLGGLVVREAMIRLYLFPKQYDGLDLRHCGLLFLSTPHSGATASDWNDYLVELAGHGGIRARDFTDLLGSFNNESRRSKELFGEINPPPPFVCLYETRKTKVAGISKLIVTADSAGLNGQTAQPMNDADHSSICKFPRMSSEGYNRVADFLVSIRRQLPNTDSADTGSTHPSHDIAHARPGDSAPSGVAPGGSIPSEDAPSRGSTRGGDARGGDAQGGNAQGGNAQGGNAQGGNARGGDARGGSAFIGDLSRGKLFGGNL